MPEADLNIILRLLDQASDGIKQATDDLKKDQEGLGKTTEDVNKKATTSTTKHKDALLQARAAVKAFHREMFILALAVGTGAAAMNEFAQRNNDARSTMDRFGLAMKNWGAVIGSYLAPALDKVSKWIENLNKGLVTGALSDEFERAKIAVKNFDDDLKKLQTTFQAGLISSQQFYQGIAASSASVIAVNRQAQQSLQELANLESQVHNKSLMEAQRLTDERISLLNEYKTNYMVAHQGMAAFTAMLSETIRTNLTTALTGVITGAKTAKEAFAELGQAMIQAIVEFMVQKLVAWVLEKTLLAGTVLATTTAANSIAAAWAPAAFLATVATLGAAAAQAPVSLGLSGAATIGVLAGLSAGFAGAATASKGAQAAVTLTDSSGSSGFTKSFHDGGMIRAHSGLAVDEVPIIAQTGEGILSRRGMNNLGGAPVLNRLNNGQSSSGGGIQVNVYYPKMSTIDEVKQLANALGLEIERQLRYAGAS